MQDIIRRVPYYGFWALLIYMPFHIFLAQSLSLATGGLEAWKIGKDVVLFALVLFTVCLVFWQGKANKLFIWLFGLSIAYGLLHMLLWALNLDLHGQSAALGIVYNGRLPAFLLLGMGAALLNPGKFVFGSVFKVVLSLSTLIAALGLLQYFLPRDILTHLGYSLERGVYPFFFIDNDPSLPRIMSTLREPNALGAYLMLPVAALVALLIRVKDIGLRYMIIGSLLLHLLAVFLTHSRSAWLGTALVVLLTLWFCYREWIISMAKRWWPLIAVLAVLGSVTLFSARNTSLFQQYFVHEAQSADDLSSTDYHFILAQESIEEIVQQPVGYGPGTAGPTSLHDPEGGQITENYYLQIAYELGMLGLAIFVALNVIVYLELRKRHDIFGMILIAAFWGYVLTNMFLHTWANEAVAAQWWLLAGIAVAASSRKNTKQ